MADSSMVPVAEIAEIAAGYERVLLRAWLTGGPDRWQLVHGELTLDDAARLSTREWRYPGHIFLECAISGKAAAELLRNEAQEVAELTIAVPTAHATARRERVPGQHEWSRVITAWPRTEWEVNASETGPQAPSNILVGTGPAFLSTMEAYHSFFRQMPPSNGSGTPPLWRVSRAERSGWLHQIIISADALDVVVKGSQLVGLELELTSPSSHQRRRVGSTGRVRMRLRGGLPDHSTLVLRHGNDWQDYRHFLPPGYGRPDDRSVRWQQLSPEVELERLIASGEGLYVEFKQELASNESSLKTILKTVAAFASGEGGTVLIGVDDEAQVVGIDPNSLDKAQLRIGNAIRDSIEPEPRHTLRAAELHGKTLLLIEVPPGGRWHALSPKKPEFYVRRGASSLPARMSEITAGFSTGNTNTVPWRR